MTYAQANGWFYDGLNALSVVPKHLDHIFIAINPYPTKIDDILTCLIIRAQTLPKILKQKVIFFKSRHTLPSFSDFLNASETLIELISLYSETGKY